MRIHRRFAPFLTLVLGALALAAAFAPPDARSAGGTGAYAPPAAAQALKDTGVLQALKDGRAKLQSGLDEWKAETLLAARDAFLKACVLNKAEQADLLYYVALADYRLASYYLVTGNPAELERFAREGQQYAQKAINLGAKSGEPEALYGMCIGTILTVHPEEGMTLGMESFQYMGQADQLGAGNPRVNMLHGMFMLYVPAEYGGGPDPARGYLETAVALFEKETGCDPVKPDWGKDEAFLNLGLLYKQTSDTARALDMFKKALAVNPKSGRTRTEIAALEKK
jgi:tetratricopeptide (TPR) repeat protein